MRSVSTCHSRSTRSSACSASASSTTNEGRLDKPMPASAAAYSVSLWVLLSAGLDGFSVTVSPVRLPSGPVR